MIKILFVCPGNICRSPMGEFILKDMVAKRMFFRIVFLTEPGGDRQSRVSSGPSGAFEARHPL